MEQLHGDRGAEGGVRSVVGAELGGEEHQSGSDALAPRALHARHRRRHQAGIGGQHLSQVTFDRVIGAQQRGQGPLLGEGRLRDVPRQPAT